MHDSFALNSGKWLYWPWYPTDISLIGLWKHRGSYIDFGQMGLGGQIWPKVTAIDNSHNAPPPPALPRCNNKHNVLNFLPTMHQCHLHYPEAIKSTICTFIALDNSHNALPLALPRCKIEEPNFADTAFPAIKVVIHLDWDIRCVCKMPKVN